MPHIVRVVSTKYDGSPRDTYEGQLIDSGRGVVRLSVSAGTPTWWAKAQKWVDSVDDSIEIYFEDRWYNLWHFAPNDRNMWYCNIAMPPTFDRETLRWVDLDIDVRCQADGSLVVLDEDEFEQNRIEMGYPGDVVEAALAARDDVLSLAGQGLFPFDHQVQISALD